MPNYRYQSSEYMRRGNCARSATASSSREVPYQTLRQASHKSGCQEKACAPVCCNDKAEYDELRNMPLAMAYVPWQEWCSLYEADKGFHRGTIFEELDKPFRGIGGCCK